MSGQAVIAFLQTDCATEVDILSTNHVRYLVWLLADFGMSTVVLANVCFALGLFLLHAVLVIVVARCSHVTLGAAGALLRFPSWSQLIVQWFVL
jgi:hypothetical protein